MNSNNVHVKQTRDPSTGRFVKSKHPPKKGGVSDVMLLAVAMTFVLVLCTLAILCSLFAVYEELRNPVCTVEVLPAEILATVPQAPVAEESVAGWADVETPIIEKDEPRKPIRVFRGSEVSEE